MTGERSRTSSGRHVVGLIGEHIGASLSPALHEREADLHGLRYVYLTIESSSARLGAEQMAALHTSAARLGFSGLNITHPYKQLAARVVDELSFEADLLGAVNTVVFDADRSIGHNTDWLGFDRGVAEQLPIGGESVVVLVGAGGAGVAVAYALLRRGLGHLVVVDQIDAHSDWLASRMSGLFPGRLSTEGLSALGRAIEHADGLVHATPVGMHPSLGAPFDLSLLEPRLWVAEIVYRPIETPLVRAARQLGCPTFDGGAMAAHQAAAAFELFTGVAADGERMVAHLRELDAQS